MLRIGAFCGAVSIAVLAGPAQAQSPSVQEQQPSMQELLRKIDALQHRVDELEGRERRTKSSAHVPPANAPSARVASRATTTDAAPVVAAAQPNASPAAAASRPQPSAASRPNVLPPEPMGDQYTTEDALRSDLPGLSLRIPGSQTELRFYGFANVNGYRDFNGRNQTDAPTVQTIPLANSPADMQGGDFSLSARHAWPVARAQHPHRGHCRRAPGTHAKCRRLGCGRNRALADAVAVRGARPGRVDWHGLLWPRHRALFWRQHVRAGCPVEHIGLPGTATGFSLDPLTTYGATAAYRRFWTPQVRSNFAYSYAWQTYPSYALLFAPGSGSATSLNSTMQQAIVNLIWSPFAELRGNTVGTGWLDVGLEYVYMHRDVFGGSTATAAAGLGFATASRLLASATIRF